MPNTELESYNNFMSDAIMLSNAQMPLKKSRPNMIGEFDGISYPFGLPFTNTTL